MKIAIILGTRPEIIKMSPLIRLLQAKPQSHLLIHSGQHYSPNMDSIFFEQLELKTPDFNLQVGSGSGPTQTAQIMIGLEPILTEHQPDYVLVQGDTNTVLAGALTASKLGIPVGHVEAGLRSNDRTMPEEINRILTDHASTLLFAPTEDSLQNLLREGIDPTRCKITGNTIVDAVHENKKIAEQKSTILKDLNIHPGHYILATSHRAENTDDRRRLSNIIHALDQVHLETTKQIIFPIHPRTKKMLEHHQITSEHITYIPPCSYMDFLTLLTHCAVTITDSGGVQEEACILQVPCVTIRDNTERPETVTVGANTIAGTSPEKIIKETKRMLSSSRDWINPYGDGTTAKQILELIETTP